MIAESGPGRIIEVDREGRLLKEIPLKLDHHAAHTDTRNGRTTIVLAQTSNDHLDELNARYQAIRREHGPRRQRLA